MTMMIYMIISRITKEQKIPLPRVGFDCNISYMEEIKDQWIDRQHSDIMTWAKSAEDIILFDDNLKVIYLFRR